MQNFFFWPQGAVPCSHHSHKNVLVAGKKRPQVRPKNISVNSEYSIEKWYKNRGI